MKSPIITSATLLTLCFTTVNAQTAADLKTQIAAAQKGADEKNYKEVNFQLQQAMASLGNVIGTEVLNILPKELAACKFDQQQDKVTNALMMMAGTTIVREYNNGGDKRISVSIAANSPLVASLSMYLNNPMYAQSMNDNSQKIVTVSGRRAIYRFDAEGKSGELQIVSGQNLISISAYNMISSEADMQGIASKVDVAKIDALIGN